MPQSKPSRFLYLCLPAVIIALAFFMRFYRLPDVPFGWHYDEGTKAMLARSVLNGGPTPAFFSAYTGRDALFVYLEALFFVLFGEGIFAGRVLAAFIGTLTIALTYATTREMFNRRTALIASAMLAVSLWHVIASRNGYRAVIQPLIQLPVLLLLFRGWRRGSDDYKLFALAGFFFGLTQYTYLAARLFPVLIVVIMIMAAIIKPSLIWPRRRSLVVFFGIALLTIIPLIVHFALHPTDLFARTTQVAIDSPEAIQASVVNTLGMFTFRGDPNFRFNIAQRPVFDWPDGILFYAGLIISVVKAVRTKGITRLGYASLIPWLVIMILPMALSAPDELPYYQRALGTLPAIYIFPALTLAVIPDKAGRPVQIGWAVAMLVIVSLLTARTYHEYFTVWHLDPTNDDHRDVDMVYAAQYANEHINGKLYISTNQMEHPIMNLLAPDVYAQGIGWFSIDQALPLPPPGQPATYYIMTGADAPPLLAESLGQLTYDETVYDRFDRPVFEVYTRPADQPAPLPPQTGPAYASWEVTFDPNPSPDVRRLLEFPINFGDTLSLQGFAYNTPEVDAGGVLEVVLYWELHTRPPRSYSFFAHLLDANSNPVGEADRNMFPTQFWEESGGETLLNYFGLYIYPDTPTGEYLLQIGLYHQPTGERMPILVNGDIAADRLLLGPIRVKGSE